MILCGFKMDHRRRGRQLHLGSKLSNVTRHAHDLLQTRGQLKNPFKWLSQAKSTRMHPVQPLCAGILPKGIRDLVFRRPWRPDTENQSRARRGKSALAVSSVV